MKIHKFNFWYHLHVYFSFYQLYKVFSKISLKTDPLDPLDELEESQSRPEPEVGAQEVEKIIEVEAVQAGPLGRDSLGESQHKRGLICLGGGLETLQHWGSGPEVGQQAAKCRKCFGCLELCLYGVVTSNLNLFTLIFVSPIFLGIFLVFLLIEHLCSALSVVLLLYKMTKLKSLF